MLIPSQLCTRAVWHHQIAALSGLAEISVADHTRADSMADIAVSILADAPPHFALAAHGMGGFIAFEIMRQAPERVERLAVMDTLASPDTEAQIARRKGYADLVEAGRFDQVVEERIPLLLHPARQSDPDLLAAAGAMAQETGAEAFLRQQQAIIDRPDSRPYLGAIACPTLVIIGDHDGIVSVDAARLIAEAIPDARLEVIEDCGHLSPLEKAETVTDLLRDWLTG